MEDKLFRPDKAESKKELYSPWVFWYSKLERFRTWSDSGYIPNHSFV